ncbi:MAG: ribosome assembly factor SBDS [Candidatus Diapherotrites archaeon]|nr:ribosome assembly factor SBDS [Candidatus Diapherotrites archaeon]
MVKMEDAVIARYERNGEKFELLVDPYLAMDLKNGKQINFDDLLAIDRVFKDANKGEEKPEDKVKEVFQTMEIIVIAKKMISEGEVQLTTAQKRELIDKRKHELIQYIAVNALNPQTNAPHPPQRIENALDEIKFHADLTKSLMEQVPEAVKQLKKLLPISFEKLQIAVKFPALYSGKAQGIVRKFNLIKEEWGKDGSFLALVEIPPGLKNQLFNEVNHLTKGDVEIKIIEK